MKHRIAVSRLVGLCLAVSWAGCSSTSQSGAASDVAPQAGPTTQGGASTAPATPEDRDATHPALVLHVDVAATGRGAPHEESFPLDASAGVQSWSIDLAPLDRAVTRTSNVGVTLWIERVPGTRVVEGSTEISLVPPARPAELERACVGDGGPGIAWNGWRFQLQTVCRERRITVNATPPAR